jgi:hypothetical protein
MKLKNEQLYLVGLYGGLAVNTDEAISERK